MWRAILRTILATALLAAGIGSLIYGAGYHSASVEEEQEREFQIPAPPGFGLPGFPGGPPLGGPPGHDPMSGPPPMMMPPPPMMTTVKEKVIVKVETPEWTLVREVTFGGVTLLANGNLRRTYAGQPPALCPT